MEMLWNDVTGCDISHSIWHSAFHFITSHVTTIITVERGAKLNSYQLSAKIWFEVAFLITVHLHIPLGIIHAHKSVPLTGAQRSALERKFNSHPYLTQLSLRNFAEQLGLSQKVVYNWFRYHRGRIRNGKLPPTLKCMMTKLVYAKVMEIIHIYSQFRLIRYEIRVSNVIKLIGSKNNPECNALLVDSHQGRFVNFSHLTEPLQHLCTRCSSGSSFSQWLYACQRWWFSTFSHSLSQSGTLFRYAEVLSESDTCKHTTISVVHWAIVQMLCSRVLCMWVLKQSGLNQMYHNLYLFCVQS